MRALSFTQASSCEYAATKRCRCRCRGALHGRARCNPFDLDRRDPHACARSCVARGAMGGICGRKAIRYSSTFGGPVCAKHASALQLALFGAAPLDKGAHAEVA